MFVKKVFARLRTSQFSKIKKVPWCSWVAVPNHVWYAFIEKLFAYVLTNTVNICFKVWVSTSDQQNNVSALTYTDAYLSIAFKKM